MYVDTVENEGFGRMVMINQLGDTVGYYLLSVVDELSWSLMRCWNNAAAILRILVCSAFFLFTTSSLHFRPCEKM
jgi:hypothetical protein